MTISPWQFARAPGPHRRAQVTLLAFGGGAASAHVANDPARFGAPSAAALAQCTVLPVARRADPRWFDAWRTGSLRAIAERDLGGRLGALDAADRLHVIRAEVVGPADLSYLQAAWAHARQLVERGATVVLDAHAMVFAAADQLPPADATLDTTREVRVVYETDSTRADRAHALHTRGMIKFGAPDLIALCSDADAPLVGHAVRELADVLARGTDPAAPRHTVEVAAGVTWYLVADEHHLGDLLQLDNHARVLVDAAGHDLVGVTTRLPRPERA